MVGLSIPGTPFIALGRNDRIAWGGTNMRALRTFLYEIDDEDIISREEMAAFWKSFEEDSKNKDEFFEEDEEEF